MQYEIFYCNLKGQYKKIRGLFTIEERRVVIEALRQANYANPFFGALYAMPIGQFSLAWTYADQPEVAPKKDEALKVAPSKASKIQTAA